MSRSNTLEFGEWIPVNKINGESVHQKLEEVERTYIVQILNKTGWKVSRRRRRSKDHRVNATTLEARMKKLGIKRE